MVQIKDTGRREAREKDKEKEKIETSACVCHYDFKSTALLDAAVHTANDASEKAEA